MTGIQTDHISGLWGSAKPLVEKALAKGSGEWNADDILDALLKRDMQLWGAFDADLVAVMVTQIVAYPRKKFVDLVLCGGRGLPFWKHYMAEVERWAADNGCAALRIYGRRGWARALGWPEVYSVIAKEL